MALEYGVTAKLPPAWKELIEKRLVDEDLKSTNAYIKRLIAQDLGLPDAPRRLATKVSDALFEDFHAASKILSLLPDELLAAIVQVHLESDASLLDRELFARRYRFPHEYDRTQQKK